MSHRFHVHPQLMRSPGDGVELDARDRARSIDVDDAIAGHARPPHGVIDFLPRAIGPIDTDRQLDLPFGSSAPMPLDHGLVALAYPALLEHHTQLALRLGTAPHDNDARRAHVQAMNDHGVGIFGLNPARQAVFLAHAAPGHTQQAAGFVDNDQLRREIEDGEPAVRGRAVGRR